MRYTVSKDSKLAGKMNEHGQEPVARRIPEGRPISFLEMEAQFKKPGGTIMHALFGADPFDFWVGRFYVGTFGVLSLIGIFFGVIFYFYQMLIVEDTTNILAVRLDPPPISSGLRLVSPSDPGFYWQLIVFFATLSFLGWLFRQVDISRKLSMGYEVPIAFGAVVSSWITIQILRPVAMGAWGNGFALGITHHLDWVSNIGYQYFNFFYNPFHAIGISLLFASTLVLAMHGSIIMSASKRPYIREGNEDGFWRNLLGYSIGEVGIHRMGFWVAASSVLFSNLCIFLSGTLVKDWADFWSFWDKIPVWEGAAFTTVAAAASVVVWRGRKRGRYVDPIEYEYGPSGLEGTFLKETTHVGFMKRLFNEGQVGPIYLGAWGVISILAGTLCSFIILEHYLYLVDYNPILFLREFFVLSLDPPPMEYGLGFAPWRDGGSWVIATGLLHVSVLAWLARIYNRARAAALGPQLFWGYVAALFLYFIIYLIRPVIIGNWAQASGHGFKAILDWTNNVSVQYGNFYYNPFHMLSIFFLLGSTLLLAMHGASIVAASKWGAHRELEEMMTETGGTQRAQLFWRWCMGWQATSRTIHIWAWWFAAMTAITGGIGLLLSGTAVMDWFQFAVEAGFVAPPIVPVP